MCNPRKGQKSKKREEFGKELDKVIDENPYVSSWKAACALGISRTLILTILHHLAAWFLSLPRNTEMIFIVADEACFTSTQPLNKQKNRIRADLQPVIA